MVRNIPIRTTIKEFTEEIDEAEYVRQCNFFHPCDENVVFVFGSYEPFALCCAPFFQLWTMAILIPHWVVNSDRLSPEEDRLREDYYYEAFVISRHIIDLEFHDETVRPQKATEAPKNAGVDPVP